MTELRQRTADLARSRFGPDWPEWLQRLLIARGVEEESQLGRSLSDLPAPREMVDLQRAAELIADVIVNRGRILIVGDYDADGATSCALMVRALSAFGAGWVDFLVPNRFDYGYGLSPEIVELATGKDPDLLITVDNGIASLAGVEAARRHGMRVVVTDHHLPGEAMPAADAIVNPNRPDCGFAAGNLAGVGVAFYVLSAVRRELESRGVFDGSKPPALGQWLDLVALGTVADVVPLDFINRILVQAGLQRIRSGRGNPGIRALFEAAGRDWRRALSTDLGFVAGPRLNAAGRLDDISHGIRCLLSDDPDSALVHATELDAINRDRRLIEQQMQAEAEQILAALDVADDPPPVLVLADPNWHQGVVGLLASRIRERYHRPTLVFAPAENGEWRGSGRSIPGLHLRDALADVAVQNPGLIDKFGGHAMAAGLTLQAGAFQAFERAIHDQVRRMLGGTDPVREIWVDGSLPLHDLDVPRVRQLQELAPWGQGFPEPQFVDRFSVTDERILKERHLKLELKQRIGGGRMEAIWFNADLDRYRRSDRSNLCLVYRPSVNSYRGVDSVQLIVVELID